MPTIVNTAVDKRLGAITKDTSSKLEEMRDDMNKRDKKLMADQSPFFGCRNCYSPKKNLSEFLEP